MTIPGDLPNDEFRRAMHEAADMAADYLEHVVDYPVLPRIAPGDVRAALPASPPEAPEPVAALLADYKRLIEPNVTHWNHPGFMAYFAISGSGPGILGETLTAALNVNAMLWRSGPAPTELEQTVCDWLRQLLALPPAFQGHINDTASSSSMLAIAAARHRAGGTVREQGLAGLPPMTVYCSEQAHSSIDKAMITLGLGLTFLRKVPVDGEFRLRPDALAQLIAEDRMAGCIPIAVVATAGTTSVTAVDPIRAVADIARREQVWLHVDAAYAGSAAICPEYRALLDGLEEADSIVVNPHKWLFTPVDCSVLLLRNPDALRAAFALVPEYLRTTEQGVVNLMDYGPQLGRRFRALKLWFVIRAFGAEGLRARIRAHCALAREFADRVRAERGWEVVAPVPFSTVCFRAVTGEGAADDRLNDAILAAVNAEGSTFLSATKLHGRTVLRLTIGNIRTTRAHVAQAWDVLRAGRRAAGDAR
ncbi:MAG: amino acid decarboxylase [Gemmatimonadetes bacterium GWC2_71_10]|nr:MAG: amino acid decarboxylase [Gemmatimonadetes bacterium GWC2_71_10]